MTLWVISADFSVYGEEGNGNPLQYSCLENPMDGGAWWAAVHGVTKSQAWLSIFTFTFYFHALEKEMATHSSVLAWRIPGTEEPHGLPSMESHRVGHNWSNLAAAAATLYCVNTTHFFPVHQGIWVISTFWLLWIMLLWIFIYGCLHRYTFPFLLSIYLECNFWVI